MFESATIIHLIICHHLREDEWGNIHFLFVYLPATITEKLKKIKITKNTPLETETNTGTKL